MREECEARAVGAKAGEEFRLVRAVPGGAEINEPVAGAKSDVRAVQVELMAADSAG